MLAALLFTEGLLRQYTVRLVPWARQVHRALSTTDFDFMVGDSQFDSAFRNPPAGWQNLAADGSNVVMIREIALYYAAKSRRPGQRIILLGSPQMFSAERQQEDRSEYSRLNDSRPDLFRHLYSFNPLIARHLITPVGDWIRSHRRGSMQAHRQWSEFSAAERQDYVRRRARKQQPMVDFRQSRDYRNYLSLLETLHAWGKNVCIFRPPWAPEYMQYIIDQPRFADADQEIRRLATAFGANHVDSRDLGLDWRDSGLFNNGDHLSPAGARAVQPLVIDACFGQHDSKGRVR